MLHLFRNADHQLISRLRLRKIDGVGRQLQPAFCLCFQGPDTKRRKIFDEVNDPVVLVKVNQVERKKQSQCMNPPRRNDPYALIGPELQPSNQSPQAREDRVRSPDIQAEETFPRLVVHAIRPSFHSDPLALTSVRLTGHYLHCRLLLKLDAAARSSGRNKNACTSIFRKRRWSARAPGIHLLDHRNAWRRWMPGTRPRTADSTASA